MLFKRKDGSTYDVSINADIYRDNIGHPQGMKGTIRDITERKIAEKKLRKSEEKFRLIFENAPLGILHYNREGILTACNDIFVNIIGSSHEKLIGLNMLTLPDTHMTDALKVALKGRNSLFEGTYSSTTAVKITPVRVLFSPVFSENNELDGGIGIIEDVTERKLAETALIESEKQFRELAELLPETIFETDTHGIITFVNQKAFDLFGFTREDFKIGINLYDLITPKDRHIAMANMKKIMRNESLNIQEYNLYKKENL